VSEERVALVPLAAGNLQELSAGRVFTVRLAPDAYGRPREAIVLIDADRTPRAYLNQCCHLPIPLDAGSRQFVVGGELMCVTHGARYRLEDGLCVAGPCRGDRLTKLDLFVDGEALFVFDSRG
jgi:nitrite reductase/ring-hydroxylating ferredoxin subunit